MHKTLLPFFILIQLLLAGSLISQTIITLTFTANTNGHHQSLDSVVVENLTQGGDTVLHYPDTVLLLDHGTAVSEPYSNHDEGLILHPAFPNPFTGQTTTRFFLPERDQVTLRVFDLLGRKLTTYQQTLPAGEHTFTFYPGSKSHYLLVVETSRDKRVQKLISLGGTGACRIAHSGLQQGFPGFRKGKSGFPWTPGDQLHFTGYATLTGNVSLSDYISDDPVTSSSYIFQLIGLPPQPSPIQGDTIPCENEAGLLYSVVLQPGETYLWGVPSGWSITAGQGTHVITVTSGTASGHISAVPSNSTGQGPAQTLAVTTQYCPIVYYPPGYVHCDTANPTAVVDVTNPITGKIWMDRNLGASQVATSSTDALAYGDLYQWGRFADGHQCRNSATTNILSSTDQPGHGNFIKETFPVHSNWRVPPNDNLWQGVSGVNNPCPYNYRLPSEAELYAERMSFSSLNLAGALASPLKLPAPGIRSSSGAITHTGSTGSYWSSTISGSLSRRLNNTNVTSHINFLAQINGISVRCIKD